MNKYLIILLLVLPRIVFGQDSVFVQKMPEYEGGQNALMQLISKNLKYPIDARDNCITGKVFVSFIVTKTGALDSILTLNSVYKSLDDEAMRVIRLTNGKWKPGSQNDKPVNVHYQVPIVFELRNAGCTTKDYYYEKADKYFKKNKYKESLENYKAVIKMDPSYSDALYKCCITYIKLNDTESACHYLSQLKLFGKNDEEELSKKYCNK